jgi:uncharacterized protein YegP (UPF0339 family)
MVDGIIDMTMKGLACPCYVVNKDTSGGWFWVYYAKNGRAIARSSENYAKKADCVRSISLLQSSQDGTVIFEEVAGMSTLACPLAFNNAEVFHPTCMWHHAIDVLSIGPDLLKRYFHKWSECAMFVTNKTLLRSVASRAQVSTTSPVNFGLFMALLSCTWS